MPPIPTGVQPPQTAVEPSSDLHSRPRVKMPQQPAAAIGEVKAKGNHEPGVSIPHWLSEILKEGKLPLPSGPGDAGLEDHMPSHNIIESPTPSDFGGLSVSPVALDFGGFKREWDKTRGRQWQAEPLPIPIQEYLEANNLEAYFVKGDGNCLFSAVTFHPKFDKKTLARQATAAYLDGIKQTDNVLGALISDEQLRKLRKAGFWDDETIGELQVKALAEILRTKIIVHDFHKEERLKNPLRPQSYGPREGVKLLSKEPVQVLLLATHYYPVFKTGTFPNTILPHQRGTTFIPGTQRNSDHGTKSSEISAAQAVPAAALPQSVHQVHQTLGEDSGTSLPVHPVQALIPFKTPPVLDESGGTEDLIPAKPSAVAENNVLPVSDEGRFWKGVAVGAGGLAAVGLLGGLATLLFRKFTKKPEEKVTQRSYRDIVDSDEESDDEMVASAKW